MTEQYIFEDYGTFFVFVPEDDKAKAYSIEQIKAIYYALKELNKSKR